MSARSVGERMNPIEAPHDIRSQVDRRRLSPVFIDVVAKILNQLPHQMGARRSMLATFNLHAGRTIVSSVRTDAAQRLTRRAPEALASSGASTAELQGV